MAEEVKDVKNTQEASTEGDVKPDPKGDEGKQESSTDEVFEGENRNIPYARFKEKATEARELKKEVERLQSEKDQAVKQTATDYQTYYESQIAKLQREKQDSFEDYDLDETSSVDKKISPLQEEINTLKETIAKIEGSRAEESLRSQVKALRSVYPEAEEEHILVTKKTKPKWTLEECAEYSHRWFEDKIKSKYSSRMEKKKEAAKKPIIGADGKLNIEASEKPKTFKDAKKRMIEYAKLLDSQ